MGRSTGFKYIACVCNARLLYGEPVSCRLTRLTATRITVIGVHCACGNGAEQGQRSAASADCRKGRRACAAISIEQLAAIRG